MTPEEKKKKQAEYNKRYMRKRRGSIRNINRTGENREIINIRLSKQEKELAKTFAKHKNISVSEFFKDLLRKYKEN